MILQELVRNARHLLFHSGVSDPVKEREDRDKDLYRRFFCAEINDSSSRWEVLRQA